MTVKSKIYDDIKLFNQNVNISKGISKEKKTLIDENKRGKWIE